MNFMQGLMEGKPTDHLPDLGRRATALQQDEPKAAWQTQLEGLEVDDLVVVAPNLVLAGTVHYENHLIQIPSHGPYVLLGVESGRKLWSFPRDPSYDASYGAFGTAGGIVVHRTNDKGTEFTCLDRESGRKLWSASFGPVIAQALDAAAERMLVATAAGGSTMVAVHDLRSGRQAWKQVLQGAEGPGEDPGVVLVEDRVFLMGKDVEVRDAATGSTLWRIEDAGPVLPGATVLPVHGGWILPGSHNRLLRVGDDGTVAWQRELGGPVGLLADGGDLLFAFAEGPGNGSVVCLRADTGEVVWTREPPGTMMSPLAATPGRIAFTVIDPLPTPESRATKSLQLWDSDTGTTVAAPRSGGFYGYCDRLVAYEDHIVVAQRGWVGAYRLSDGGCLWSNDVRSIEHLELSSVSPASSHQGGPQVAGPASPAAETQAATSSLLVGSVQRRPNPWIELSRRKISATYQLTRPVLEGESPSTPAEREAARGQRITAVRGGIVAARVASVAARTDAWVSLHFALQGAAVSTGQALGKALAQAWIAEADRKNARKDSELELRAWQRNVSGDWYVEVFARGRSGLLAVDMRTGDWAELTTAPSESPLFHGGILATFDPSAGHLLSSGTGLDPQRWRPYQVPMYGMHPSAAIVGFRLADLPLQPPERYATRLRASRGREHLESFRAWLPEVKVGKTHRRDLEKWLGPPDSSVVGGNSLCWAYSAELAGDLRYLSLLCELDGGVVKGFKLERKMNYLTESRQPNELDGLDEFIAAIDVPPPTTVGAPK